jgi:hypothetical protein
MSIRKWLSQMNDRRRSPRMKPEGLVAYYWTGAIPRPNSVREIGPNGARLEAPSGFYLGTVIEMTLQDLAEGRDSGDPSRHSCVHGRVVRTVADGFCVEFVFHDAAERRRFREFLDGLNRRDVDEKTVAKKKLVAQWTVIS